MDSTATDRFDTSRFEASRNRLASLTGTGDGDRAPSAAADPCKEAAGQIDALGQGGERLPEVPSLLG
ncbi:hypothetical protein AB0N06_34250 [Streptomyces sp. NPDC051020]|uniref:hypothetical protein n=1 Tax=Streptomyces sp. NPDC051020 TaxID=3155409 RepID=UPI00343AADD4